MLIRRATVLATAAGLAVALPAAAQSIPWLSAVNGNWNEAAKWTGGNIPDAVGEIARLNVAGTYTVTQNVGGLTLSAINVTTPTATLNLVGNSVTVTGAAGLTNSGSIVNSGGNTTISGALNNNASGTIGINANTAITLNQNVTNNGLLTVNVQGNSGFTTTLVVAAPLTFSGNGSIVLNANANTAQIISSDTGSIENASSHTIRGWGQIVAPLINQGLVSANVANQRLHLNTNNKTNNATMQAAGEGILSIVGVGITQNASGLLLANDSPIELTNATISGGSLGSAGDGAVVNIGGTSTLTNVTNNGLAAINANTAIVLNGSFFDNEGTLVVNTQANSGFTTTLHASTPVLLDGAGEIILNANANTAQITSGAGVPVTNGSLHLIHGRGQIAAQMVNDGTVSADSPSGPLHLNTASKTNTGVMEALGGSTLAITSIGVTQSGSGMIVADEGLVDLSNAGISNGMLHTIGAGRIRGVGGTQTLAGVTLNGNAEIMANTAMVLDGGSLVNNGSILVNQQANSGFTTTLQASGAMNVSGTGEIVLNANASAAQVTTGAGGLLTMGAGQVVRGYGQIAANMTNNGLVNANVDGRTISLNSGPKANNGTMRASNNGNLEISGITVSQAPSAEIQGDGGAVRLSNATIIGGVLRSMNGGEFQAFSGTQTLNNVTLNGRLEIDANQAAVLSAGTFFNNGTVVVNTQANSGFTTTLGTIGGDVAINGTGEIVLNGANSAGQITSSGGTVTLGVGQNVHGFGQISAPLVNNGLVNATVPGQALSLHTSSKTNNGQLRASGGTLAISGISVTQSPSGFMVADNSSIDMSNATLNGGSLFVSGTGRYRGVGGTQNLSGLLIDAPLDINANTAISLTGGIVNDGSIVVNAQANGGFTTTLHMNGPVTMTGDGEIVLNASNSAAQITHTTGSLTMGPEITLRGIGNIAAPLTTHGTIAPGFSVGTINVPSTSTVVTHEPDSAMSVELASGASYDRVTGGSHTINGGTVVVTLTGGYTPPLFTKHTIIDGSGASTVTGKFDGIVAPAPAPGTVWKIGYTAQDVFIGVTCPSDTNADFTVDILDFLDFIDDFAACELQPAPCGDTINADYNGDTFVDILDFLDFIDAFANGC